MSGSSFPIVGIGASAGGLEAFTTLLQQLPSDTGMAFVLVQHLDPQHESELCERYAEAARYRLDFEREVTGRGAPEGDREGGSRRGSS